MVDVPTPAVLKSMTDSENGKWSLGPFSFDSQGAQSFLTNAGDIDSDGDGIPDDILFEVEREKVYGYIDSEGNGIATKWDAEGVVGVILNGIQIHDEDVTRVLPKYACVTDSQGISGCINTCDASFTGVGK